MSIAVAIGCASTTYVEPDPGHGSVATIAVEPAQGSDLADGFGSLTGTLGVYGADDLCSSGPRPRIADAYLGYRFLEADFELRVVGDRPVFFELSLTNLTGPRSGGCARHFGFLPAGGRSYKILVDAGGGGDCSVEVVTEVGAPVRTVRPSRCFRDGEP
jgi:hypothetical protein